MRLRRFPACHLLVGLLLAVPVLAAIDDYKVYTESPRLLLRPQRLRMLRRERERQSIRWQQFDLLMAGNAQMPETGFAEALYSQVTQDPARCQRAIQWASTAADFRQVALVADWCGVETLRPRLEQMLARTASAQQVAAVRDRIFAALALADAQPDLAARVLEAAVESWWNKQMAPRLANSASEIPRKDVYALMEIVHALRDNLRIDLRDAAPAYFKELPVFHILSYYPAPYPAPENEYRIPFFTGDGDPDLTLAAMSRAAELAMVAYDANLPENQFLQGWLIQDRFLLKGAFGIPYEFLWANPYQPGLSFHYMPNLFHDKRTGRLFVRANWDEDSSYFCFYEGQVQFFEEGKRRILKMRGNTAPVEVGGVRLLFGQTPMKLTLEPAAGPEETRPADEPRKDNKAYYFFIGLTPNAKFDLEIDDQELAETVSDAGGIVALEFPALKSPLGLRLRERR